MTIRLARLWACAASLAVCFGSLSALADAAIGQVKTAKGDVKVLHNGATQPLRIGDHVFQSDTITTAKDSAVGITFLDNSMMSLGPASQLALDQFRFDTTTHGGI